MLEKCFREKIPNNLVGETIMYFTVKESITMVEVENQVLGAMFINPNTKDLVLSIGDMLKPDPTFSLAPNGNYKIIAKDKTTTGSIS